VNFIDLIVSLAGVLLGLLSLGLGIQAWRRKSVLVRQLTGSPIREARGVPLIEKSPQGFRVVIEGNDFPIKRHDRGKVQDGAQNVVSYLQDGKRLFVVTINGILVGDLGGAKT
jgi:hypothetical protein